MLRGNGNLNRQALHRRIAFNDDERDIVGRGLTDDVANLLGARVPPVEDPAAAAATTTAPAQKPAALPVTTTSVKTTAALPSAVLPITTSTTAKPLTTPTSTSTSSSVITTASSQTSSVVASTTPRTTSTQSPTTASIRTTDAFTPKPSIRTNIAGSSPSTSVVHAPSSTAAPSSGGVSTSTVIGGIVGSLLVVTGLVMLGMFCMRRMRRRSERKEFNAIDFRSSALMSNDTPARPPTMIERSIANRGPATYGATDNGASQQHGNTYTANAYNTYGQPTPSFAHGQATSPGGRTPTSSAPLMPPAAHMLASDSSQFTPFSPTTGQANFSSGPAIFSPSVYGASPFSPVEPEFSHPGDQYAAYSTHETTGNSTLTRAPSAAPSYVSRQNSRSAHGHQNNYGAAQAHYAELDRSQAVPQAQYADMNRESVTPYQAAQYAEIARQLNSDPTKSEAEKLKALELLQEEPSTPFSPVPEYTKGIRDSERRASDPFNPSPPSPSYGSASRERIDSKPPMLPNLPSSYSPVVAEFASDKLPSPHSPHPHNPLSNAGMGLLPSPHSPHSQSPLTSVGMGMLPSPHSPHSHSPLSGAGMSYPTSAVAGDNVLSAPKPAIIAPTQAEVRGRQLEDRGARPDTMYTVYDPEDAYGGF